MSPKYKLNYFNSRGIAEPLRYMLAYKEVDYEDNRVKKEDWPTLKPKTPFGHIPTFEVDGHTLAETQAIGRYIARELGLGGQNNLEAAKIDMYLDFLKDCFSQRRAFVIEQDPAKKEEMKNKFYKETIPPCLDKLEHYLKENGGKHFVGDGLTWADFTVAFYVYETRSQNGEIVENYPTLVKLVNYVHNLPQIKAWIEKRPKTEI